MMDLLIPVVAQWLSLVMSAVKIPCNMLNSLANDPADAADYCTNFCGHDFALGKMSNFPWEKKLLFSVPACINLRTYTLTC